MLDVFPTRAEEGYSGPLLLLICAVCGVRIPHHRQLLGSRYNANFVSAHTKHAVVSCDVRAPHHR